MRYFDVPFALIFLLFGSLLLLLRLPFMRLVLRANQLKKHQLILRAWMRKLCELTKGCEFILISLCISFCVWCWFSKWKAFMHDSPCITHCIFNLSAAPGHLPMERRRKKTVNTVQVKWRSFLNEIFFTIFSFFPCRFSIRFPFDSFLLLAKFSISHSPFALAPCWCASGTDFEKSFVNSTLLLFS